MATYRWLAYDLMSMQALAELPLADVTYSGALNGAGVLTATLAIPAGDPVTGRHLLAATVPERTVIFPDRDRRLMDGYVVWVRTRRPGQPVRLQAASIASLLRRNRLVTDYTATDVDQFTIARQLVDAIQAQPGGNFGIDTSDTTLSGRVRTRSWKAYERKNIGEALSQLGAVEDGFDWSIDVAWSATAVPVPEMRLALGYPQRGRLAGETGVVFSTEKRNLLGYEFTEDGTRSARAVDAFGAGDGADMLISTAARTDWLDAGWPLTAEQISHKDVVEADTLAGHAAAEVADRAATPSFLTVAIAPDDIDAGLGTWITGDMALVEISDEVFPTQADGSAGFREYLRIINWSVTVPSAGAETVEVILGRVP